MMNETEENTNFPNDKPWELPQKNLCSEGWGLVRLKLAMAILVGIGTAMIGFLTGLYSLRQPHSWVCLPQRDTVWPKMWSVAEYLNEYKEEHGVYPATLEEMTSRWTDREGKPLSESDIAYRMQDGWKNPLIYRSDGKTWELLSYGADGKPGGIGLDTDIRSTDTDEPNFGSELYKNAVPTVEQVFRSNHFGATAVLCGLAGVFCFVLAVSQLFSMKNCVTNRQETVLTAIGIMLGTSVIVAFHAFFQSIASGH